MLQPEQHIHIVGVGGFGMSAIARVLLQRGYTVSGSDLRANDFTRALAAQGATIYQGHAADQIVGADVIVRTSAATDDNPEVAAGLAAGLPVLRRQDMLGALMAQQTGIAIAGTHGKTTTTALLVHVLLEAGLDPTYIIGGVLQNTGTNAGVGQGAAFVIEADEYDHMFLGLRPRIAVVTNVEHDHPDCFPTEADVLRAFSDFVARLPEDGLLVVCADDVHAHDLGLAHREAGGQVVFYGLQSGDWQARDVQPDEAGGMAFEVWHEGQPVGCANLAQAGTFNVLNALAVLAVAHQLDVPFAKSAAALASFLGTGRRGEVLGSAGGVRVLSDYAHHPTAIRVTLEARRAQLQVHSTEGRAGDLWAVWQPHTFNRMRALAGDFAHAFAAAQHVLVTDVYSVRETVSAGLDAPGMADRIRAAEHPDVRYTGSLNETARYLAAHVQAGDEVVILSAGDAPQVGEQFFALRRDQER